MHILFVTNLYPTNNPLFGIFVKEQVEEIAKTKCCTYDVYFLNAKEKGNFQYIVSLFAIPSALKKNHYDIIHIHYGFSGLFLLTYRPKAKVFLTLHGSDILPAQGKPVQVFFVKKILKRVYKVFALSKEMETALKPLQVNYEILPCGVDTQFFKDLGRPKSEAKEKLVLFPADPSRKIKNFKLFLQVIDKLRATTNLLFSYACIHQLSREGVRDLMNQADCLLMTSTSEGSPQVIKEALSCGLPVVSVPVGDVDEMVANVPCCFVSNSYSTEELSHLVLQSLGGDRMLIRQAFIDKNVYDQPEIVRRLIKNYRAAVST